MILFVCSCFRVKSKTLVQFSVTTRDLTFIWKRSQTKIEMQGMPYAVPPTTHSQCITKEEMIPGNKAENSGCEVTDITNTGDTVTWAMRCDQQGTKTTSKGSVTYSGSTFKGKVIMQTQNPGSGGVMTISSYMDGKRIGACQ
ncbi:MAG: DUF3617 family protein [Candidatus Sedimenticola sp. (ex Thyasira tokunagai)]